MQDSNFREVRRLTTLLLKIKRYERQREALGKTAALQDMQETKEVSSLAPECHKALSHSNESS
jgi:RPA family protein